MIAAAPLRDPSLGLTKLIFSLRINQSEAVPPELKEHLEKIISQAKALSGNPKNIPGNINPEAIALAIGMKSNTDLATELNRITTFDSIDANLASKILELLGASTAYQN